MSDDAGDVVEAARRGHVSVPGACVLCDLKESATRLYRTKPPEDPDDLAGFLGGVLFGFSAGILVERQDELCETCQRVLARCYT